MIFNRPLPIFYLVLFTFFTASCLDSGNSGETFPTQDIEDIAFISPDLPAEADLEMGSDMGHDSSSLDVSEDLTPTLDVHSSDLSDSDLSGHPDISEDHSMEDSAVPSDTSADLAVDLGTDSVIVDLGPSFVPVLGNGSHTLDAVDFRIVSQASDALNIPRDLTFNPGVAGQLWVVNRGNESMVVYENIGTDSQTSTRYNTSDSAHFFAQPSALAWGDGDTFATIHETDDPTQGSATPGDFMGPTLQWANLSVFDAGHSSHLDMLHNSPNGMGIAWETGNVYWVFDGYHSSISMYDFREDHGPGGGDHSGAVLKRYVEGQVRWLEDVPSHMEYDHSSDLLYIADTGNNRIAVLDSTTGERGVDVTPDYDGSTQIYMNGADFWTLIDGPSFGLEAPSGLELQDGMIFIADNLTSQILAFSMEGELIDWLDTELPSGSLMGITFDSNGWIYLVDAVNHEIYELKPVDS
jgi:hypothetical protein